ncbi:hypothetical protein HYU11_03740 [Candidatus Woesearchaeota archaeon]|nr:hypothetical protein [Candidatus Woesearchaeota archaeon]
MDEVMALRFSLVSAFIGLAVILVVSFSYKPGLEHVYDIGRDDANKFVRVKGKISSVDDKGAFYIIRVSEVKEISVVFFKGKNNASLSVGREIEASGRVTPFGNKMEIVAEKVDID